MGNNTPQRRAADRIGIPLLIAASYFAAGKLGLLFATAPGFATFVWPSSGIALGGLLLWGTRNWTGVWLGALLLFWTTATSAAGGTANTLPLAALLATGATLQACLGAKLLRRFIETTAPLTREREVLAFFAIGGPLVHLLGASWSTAILVLADELPMALAAQNWWTCWAGETVGALIFTPVMVLWLSDAAVWSSRRTVITVPLLGTFAAITLLFTSTGRWEWQYLEQHFAQDAGELANKIDGRLDLDIEALHSVGAIFAAAHTERAAEIGRDTFVRFAGPLLARHGELQAVEWAPRISRSDGTASFPIKFAASPGADLPGVGVDISDDAIINRTLQAALERNAVTATEPMSLDNGGKHDRFVLLLPVFAAEQSVEQSGTLHPNAQRKELLGYVVSVVSVPRLIKSVEENYTFASSMQLSVDDVARSGDSTTVYASADRPEQRTASFAALNLSTQKTLDVAGREWRLSFAPTLDYLALRPTPSVWLVLLGGSLFTALIGAGALLVTGRAHAIEVLVSQRTTELAQINAKLADEICDHLSTEHALEKERELLNAVLNNLYEGLFVLDSGGDLQMANGVAYRMLADIAGDGARMRLNPPPFKMYAPDGATELLAEQTPQFCALRGQTVSDFEMVVQTPGRAPMTLIVNAQPLVTSDHRRHGAIVVMRDITDSKEIERMKTEFVATVSHELRTPITSIRGSLGLIAGGAAGALPDKTRNLVEIALRNSDRLAHLINDLLDIEKMESGKMQFELHTHSLATLIEQSLEANSGYAHRFNVRFRLLAPVPDAWVTVDSLRLLQVMSNLLSNAAKFSPSNSTVDVTLRVGEHDGHHAAHVAVTDHGPGIPDEFRPRLFQKFSQADSADNRAKSGTGLGLAICKTIIEQLGGTIGYETELGVGSTFYFELPLAEASAENAAERAAVV